MESKYVNPAYLLWNETKAATFPLHTRLSRFLRYLDPMLLPAKFRRIFPSALTIILFAATAPAFGGQLRGAPRAAFAQRSMGNQGRPHPNQGRQGPRPQKQEHLEQWMNRHSNLPLDQQQRALESEPGFRQLPAQTQQHLRNRLTQLNNMPPEQRRRFIERNEAMERLTQPQRQQVLGAVHQLGALPEDRRRLVAHAFRDLREMPPPQRQAVLNSDRFRGQFSDQERGTLSDLLAVEPYLPASHPNEATQPGK